SLLERLSWCITCEWHNAHQVSRQMPRTGAKVKDALSSSRHSVHLSLGNSGVSCSSTLTLAKK
ncbi:MAG: hypothetical protein ACK4QP_22400, partial [Pseudorhizobium sp.]